jgi:hypothetical protein
MSISAGQEESRRNGLAVSSYQQSCLHLYRSLHVCRHLYLPLGIFSGPSFFVIVIGCFEAGGGRQSCQQDIRAISWTSRLTGRPERSAVGQVPLC